MVNTSDILPNTPRYLKVPLIFFNLVLWILGVILIALGAWALNQLKSVNGLDINVTLPSGLVVLGVFIIILTVVGCVVAYKEQLVGLIAYTVIILILLICLIGVGGAAFSYRGNTPSLLNTAWHKADDGVRAPLERLFSCCGWGGVNETYAKETLKDGTECTIMYTNETIPIPTTTTGASDGSTTSGDATTGTSGASSTTGTTAVSTSADSTTTGTTSTTDTTDTTGTTSTTGTAGTTTTTSADTNSTDGAPVALAERLVYLTFDNNSTLTNYTKGNITQPDCQPALTNYVKDRLYVAGVAGVVIGVIEFVCMLFSLFLIVRLCRNPSARSYD